MIYKKIIMETIEGTKIDLLTLPDKTYGKLIADLIQDDCDVIAKVVLSGMYSANKRFKDIIVN